MNFRLMLDWSTLSTFFTPQDQSLFEVVGVFDPADSAAAASEARCLQPDAVLFNVPPGNVNPGLISALRKVCPFTAIIVWACSEKPEDIETALKAGADSYLVQENVSPAEFLKTVRLICQTKLSFLPGSALSFFFKT